MRRLLLLAALLLLASPAGATISYITNSGLTTLVNTAANTCVAGPGATIPVGSDVVVVVVIRTGTNSLASVVDSAGNTYAFKGRRVSTSATEVWVAHNTTTQLITSSSITATIAASGTSKMVCMVAGYSGVAAVDFGGTKNHTGTNPTTSNWTQDSNNWIVAGFGVWGTGAPTSGTGNLRTGGSTSGGAGSSNCTGGLNDNSSASPALVTNAVTSANNNIWSIVTIELRTVTPVIVFSKAASNQKQDGFGAALTVTVTINAGDTVIVCATGGNGVSSITDTGGSTYTKRGSTATNGAELWSTSAGGALASTSVTVNFNSVAAASASVSTYTGVQALGAIATPTSGTSTAPSISLTTQDDKNVVASGMGNALTAASGWSESVGKLRTSIPSTTTARGSAVMDNTSPTPASVTCTATLSASVAWDATAIELRSTTGGAAPAGTNKRRKLEKMDPIG